MRKFTSPLSGLKGYASVWCGLLGSVYVPPPPGDTTPPVLTGYVFDGIDEISATLDEPGFWYWLVDGNATRTAAQIIAGGGLAAGSFSLSTGANLGTMDFSTVSSGSHYLHGVPTDTTGNTSDALVQTALHNFPGVVPNAFVVGEWTLTDPATGGDLLVTINSLPAANTDSISSVEYRVNGGSWTPSGGTVTFTIPSLTDGVSTDVELRVVSTAGNSLQSDLKAQTPTAGAPAANILPTSAAQMTDPADWGSFGTGGVSGGVLQVRNPGAFSSNTTTIQGRGTGVTPGSSYDVAMEVVTFTAGGNTTFGVQWYDSGGGFISTTSATTSFGSTGVKTAQFVAPAGAASASILWKPFAAGYDMDLDNASITEV